MQALHFGPLVQALADYQDGDDSAMLVVWRDDGLAETLPVDFFFRTPDRFTALEQQALAMSRGNVLDCDAFAGSHSLALQSDGRKVCGLALSALGADLLSRRGLIDSRYSALHALSERFDTVLKLSPGIGIADSLEGLDGFLRHSRAVVADQGQLLLLSRDVTRAPSPLYFVYALLNRNAGRYPGEVRLQLEYRGMRGRAFQWLHVDTDTLKARAALTGWGCEVVCEGVNGDYLARLVPAA
jgi:hypothetical protein